MEVKRQHNDPNLPVTAHQLRLCLSKGSSRRLREVCKTTRAMYASCHLVSSDFALQPCVAALQAKRVLAASQHIHCEHGQGDMACGGTPTMAACAVASCIIKVGCCSLASIANFTAIRMLLTVHGRLSCSFDCSGNVQLNLRDTLIAAFATSLTLHARLYLSCKLSLSI